MRHSIKKIFQNLKIYLFFILFIAFIALLVSFESTLSYEKVDNLHNQQKIITKLTKLDKSDLELALIEFNGKSIQLHQEIDNLQLLYKYAYLEKFLLNNEEEYKSALQKLSLLTDKFNQAAKEYYIETDDKQYEMTTKIKLQKALEEINQQIKSILIQTLTYNEKKFKLIHYFIIGIFFLILIATFYYNKMLNAIYKDIEFLSQNNKNKKTYSIFSQEADAISLRMNRRTQDSTNPDLIDPVTQIHNYKGLVHMYELKKDAHKKYITTVSVLEIDNFSQAQSIYPENIKEAILKKIAYTLSLHAQAIDVVSRTGYNQFTIILSRSTKEQAFKDVEKIQQSISELKFTTPSQTTTKITVSGGFVVKQYNSSLKEAIKQAKEILTYAQSIGRNKILQSRDFAHKEI